MAENSDMTETVVEGQIDADMATLGETIAALGQLVDVLAEKGVILADTDCPVLRAIDLINAQALQLVEAQDQLTALKADVGKAKKAPSAKAVGAPKARKIKPIALKDGETPLTPTEIKVLIDDAETVEVAFSDGKLELAGLPAQVISGDAWHVGVAGLQLRLPELVAHGPGIGQPGYSLAGYGLLIDGDLVAYADRGGVLPIAPGAKVNLASDIVFRG